jgi:hypothetical protein
MVSQRPDDVLGPAAMKAAVHDEDVGKGRHRTGYFARTNWLRTSTSRPVA